MAAFAPLGITYRPISIAGWLVTAAAVAFLATCFIAIDRHAHSVSDALYGFYPYAGVTFLLWSWLADRLARQRGT